MEPTDAAGPAMATPEALPGADITVGGRNFRVLHCDPLDHLLKQIRATGRFYEADLLDRLGRFIRPGDLVIDIGANIGNHTLYFAGICDARVAAFEPNPAASSLLRANLQENDLASAVEIHEMALGNAADTGRIDASQAKQNLGAASVTQDSGGAIRIARLDDILPDARPVLVKIDVEGMESAVLEGMTALLARAHPVIAVEATSESSYEAVAAFLGHYAYVPVATYNFSPTHIFVRFGWRHLGTIIRDVARQTGRTAVRAFGYYHIMEGRIRRLEARLERLERERYQGED
jgi:FkbM family methyltransferase